MKREMPKILVSCPRGGFAVSWVVITTGGPTIKTPECLFQTQFNDTFVTLLLKYRFAPTCARIQRSWVK